MRKFCMLALLSTHTLVAYAQILVVSTIPALGLLVKEIGGEHVEVKNLFENPTDPHFFQITPNQLILMRQADFVITAEEFADKIPLPASKIISINRKNEQSKLYLNALKHLQHHQHNEHNGQHEHERCDCHHAIVHEWISFYGAIALNEVIVEKLSCKYKENAEEFQKNAALSSEKIKILKNLYRYKSMHVKSVSYHSNFQNLAHELHRDLGPSLYNCEESNVSAHEMATIMANQENYADLLVDSITNPQSLERIKDKLDLPIVLVDTLGYDHPESYSQFLERILKIIYHEPEGYQKKLQVLAVS